jgi:nucleoside-diphosphate-sugar epimerase
MQTDGQTDRPPVRKACSSAALLPTAVSCLSVFLHVCLHVGRSHCACLPSWLAGRWCAWPAHRAALSKDLSVRHPPQAKKHLNWEPKVPLREGLALMVADFKKRLHVPA